MISFTLQGAAVACAPGSRGMTFALAQVTVGPCILVTRMEQWGGARDGLGSHGVCSVVRGLDVIPVAAQITCPQWHGVAVHTLRGVGLSPLWHSLTWQRSVGR